jgi:signal transduction histidine kinase
VFENVISNALKHNDSVTRVTVRADSIGRAIRVTVADDGERMSRRDLRKVMKPFYRGTRAVADQIPGSGLGLALAAQVVRYHGGRLRMQSVQQRGTTVSIEVPLGKIEPQDPRGAT